MAHFRVRYATNNGRFQPCTITNDIVLSDTHPTAFPQNRGRSHNMLQHDRLPVDEDAFFVDIWTPNTDGIKPVLFWIHGGSFSVGASGDKHNDASLLSKNTDIVVVSVTYRLGYLGTAFFEGIPQQNCGFHDIITALEWTNHHIEHFNGNPRNITIGGQSSGAWYAMALHTSPAVQHLFQRTMLFSWPGTMQAVPQETASDIHNHFCKVLARQTSATITNADIHDILITELRIGKYNKKQYDFLVSFIPSEEPNFIAKDFFTAIQKIEKPIYLQCTENECGIYVYKFPIGKYTPLRVITPFLKRYCPENTYEKLKASRKQTHDSYQTVVDVTSDILFFEPARKIVEICGKKAILNAFTYPAANKKTQCCHCFDLPFLFGNIDNWETSKIFQGCDFSAIRQESIVLQKKIANFVNEIY